MSSCTQPSSWPCDCTETQSCIPMITPGWMACSETQRSDKLCKNRLLRVKQLVALSCTMIIAQGCLKTVRLSMSMPAPLLSVVICLIILTGHCPGTHSSEPALAAVCDSWLLGPQLFVKLLLGCLCCSALALLHLKHTAQSASPLGTRQLCLWSWLLASNSS